MKWSSAVPKISKMLIGVIGLEIQYLNQKVKGY
jgi:hypothetical protein